MGLLRLVASDVFDDVVDAGRPPFGPPHEDGVATKGADGPDGGY